jgi:hypothetical protein
MKIKTKRIIAITIIILSILGIIFTVLYAKNNLNKNQFENSEPTMKENNFSNEPPEIPSGNNSNNQQNNQNSNNQDMEQNKTPQGNMNQENMGQNNMQESSSLTTSYIIIIGILSLTLSLSIIYLLMSLKNDKFYKNKDKLTIYILLNIILVFIFTLSTTLITNNLILKNSNQMFKEENAEKEEVELDETNVIIDSNIDLSNETTDVTIKSSGIYTFTGSFTHSIIIDATDEEVELILNNVTISNENTAAIIGLNASKIKITLEDDSTNTLSDGGNSTYDGCIYSNAELEFTGNGTLIVNGNQNEGEGIATEAKNMTFNGGTYKITSNDDGINAGGDGATLTINDGTFYIDASGDGIDSNKNAIINGGTIFVMGSDTGGDAGIDTDDGYEINGGLVVALGSDMIETPLTSSTQKSIAFTLDDKINKNTIVTLMKEDIEIISFEANKSFKTIIISTSTLEDGEYSLYSGGTNSSTLTNGIYENISSTKGNQISVNNQTTFTISSIVNSFGKTNNR